MTTKLLQNCFLIAICESWLTSKFMDPQIALANYVSIRADRFQATTGKTSWGGLAIYINKHRCESFQILWTHSGHNLETMATSLRPFWTHREESFIIVPLIYCTVYETTSTDVSRATTELTHKEVDELETSNPNATIIAPGNLDHVNITLPKYRQRVKCPTRGVRTLDKCSAKLDNC